MSEYFRTIKTSDARFEFDGLKFVTVKSKYLGRRGNVLLYLPDGIENLETIPVYILLHGVYGSAWSWALNAGAHKTADRLIKEGAISPCILAMPSDGLWGDGSGYVEHEYESYEKWVVKDVKAVVESQLQHKSIIESYSISGLSMGGYGALCLGAKYGNHFKAISAHSAIIRWDEMQPFVEENIYMINNPNGHQNAIDLLKANKDNLPALRFDCGIDDDLVEANRLLHNQLLQEGIDHIYEEFSGGHEWPYWEKHIEKTLYFFDNTHRP